MFRIQHGRDVVKPWGWIVCLELLPGFLTRRKGESVSRRLVPVLCQANEPTVFNFKQEAVVVELELDVSGIEAATAQQGRIVIYFLQELVHNLSLDEYYLSTQIE